MQIELSSTAWPDLAVPHNFVGERYTPTLFPGPPSIPNLERSFQPRCFASYLALLWECFEQLWRRLVLAMRTATCWSPQVWSGSACSCSHIRT